MSSSNKWYQSQILITTTLVATLECDGGITHVYETKKLEFNLLNITIF